MIVVNTTVTLTATCDFPGCTEMIELTGPSAKALRYRAKKAGWTLNNGKRGGLPQTARCKAHYYKMTNAKKYRELLEA